MNKSIVGVLAGGLVSLFPVLAGAHVEIASGPAFANQSQEVAFGVGHGCEGLDTLKVRIEIPAAVTSVRAMRSDFGKPSFEKNAAGVVTAVTWQKPDSELLDSDLAYYKLILRLKAPAAPFTTLHFPAHQTCRKADGTEVVVDWVATTEGGDAEPAPALKILPARRAGWNKFTVPVAVADLSVYFSDAAIVWKGTAAYSANPATTELIAGTQGVTALTSLAANDEIWVKY